MFLVKKFKFTMERGLELVNKEELNSYIEEKIQHFSKYENYSSKEERLKLLDEIVQMCDYDKNNAIFDYTALPSFEGFNIADKEPHMIYYFNLAFILGGIFLNVFDKEKNRIARVEDGISGAINTRSMFLRAYDELIRCKNDNLKPAYGATLIFATLIEKEKNISAQPRIENPTILGSKQYFEQVSYLKLRICLSKRVFNKKACPIPPKFKAYIPHGYLQVLSLYHV